MQATSRVFYLIFSVSLSLIFLSQNVNTAPSILGQNCLMDDYRKSSGVCKEIGSCNVAVANLWAGIPPTLCDKALKSIVCCPTEKRISAKKCEEYTEVLKSRNGPVPLLPPPFLNIQKDVIKCLPNLNQLVVGGRDAKQGEFPHSVALGYNASSYEWKCGGTLISDQWVITAAHCVDNSIVGPPIKILIGDVQLTRSSTDNEDNVLDSRQVVGIANIVKHPQYKSPSAYHDLALIKLNKKLRIQRQVFPACLPQEEFRILSNIKNTTFVASGWGKLGHGEPASDILQAVKLEGFGRNECENVFKNIPERPVKIKNGIIPKQLCAGSREKIADTCDGDSGSGITINREHHCVFYVVGVTSFGFRLCGFKQPGVYTNVLSYLDFIEQNVWPEG